jgi:E3 ubiquitin-protein ligase SHPRH
MRKVSKKASSHSLVQIPKFPPVSSGSGIECSRIMEQFNELGSALDTQADTLDEWRKQTIKYLLQPLVDEDEGLEITGDEYEESTKTQDEVMVYVQALRTAIEDRHDSLTGQENILVKGEVKTALRLAKEGEGACPVKVIELLNTRWNVKPPKKFGSFRAIISDLRALAASLKIETELGNNLATHELSMVEIERQKIQLQHNEQNKAVTAFRKEIDVFSNLMNGRLEYYRQLQQISDMVAPLEEPQRLRPDALLEEEKFARRVTIASSKHRYLIHLKNEAADQAQQRLCVICQSVFELGVLTVCGHQFCKECIGLWWSSHRNCPVCKRKLTQNDIQDITYKEKELRVSEEIAEMPQRASSSTLCTENSEIYSRISNSTLAQIKNINLEGPPFTTKIANIARHLLWIRESDPGAKSIIFSQFKEFLEVLGRALAAYRIGYSSVDKPNGIEKFKGDPGVECFLLHARAHSSGLNLINANHVFLCEPLINTALELQAIARVDRIGQYQTTKVYLYIIDGTVEQSIYEESVKRRLKHLSQTTKGKGKELTSAFLHSSIIEQANTFEMEQAVFSQLLTKDRVSGEIVEKEDLWRCLFGNVGRE